MVAALQEYIIKNKNESENNLSEGCANHCSLPTCVVLHIRQDILKSELQKFRLESKATVAKE